MPNGLFTPELIIQVAEAGEDLVITPKEFGSIMGIITTIFIGIAIAGFVGMLMRSVAKGFTEGTGIKTKEIAGIPIPIYGY